MQKFSRVVLTVAMLLGMLSLVPLAQATTYDPTNLNPPVAERLVRLNQGNAGDALYGDFYRATVGADFVGQGVESSNFLTYVSVENTSDDWVAAHIRLRSGRYSVEILDFPILLSPHDVFWFQFEAIPNADGTDVDNVLVHSGDVKTLGYSDLPVVDGFWTADVSNVLLKRFKKLVKADPALDQTHPREFAIGHIEVFGLWRITASAAALAGQNFTTLQKAFYEKGFFQPNFEGAAPIAPADCLNVLTGQVFSGDFTNGLYTGYSMHALVDFRSDCEQASHRDLFIRTPTGKGLTGSSYNVNGPIIFRPLKLGVIDTAYNDPDWATAFGPTWNDGDDWTNGGSISTSSWSLDEVDDALAKESIRSTYFNTGFTGQTFTMLVVTFPTKYLHVGFNLESGIPSSFEDRIDSWPVGQPDLADQVRAQMRVKSMAGVVSLYGRIFDLEETAPRNDVSPVFFPPLKWEVNVLPIGLASRTVLSDFSFLTHDDQSPFDQPADPFNAGWLELMGFGMSQDGVDPRTAFDPAYDRNVLPLLNCLQNDDVDTFGTNRLIPASAITMDWEFHNFPHARAFIPGFNNPNDCPTGVEFPSCAVSTNDN